MNLPLAKIVEWYDKPLTEDSNIEIEYNVAGGIQREVSLLQRAAEVTMNIRREELGISHIRPLHISSELAEILRKNIQGDHKWQKSSEEIVNLLAPSLSLDAPSIRLPWWNSSLVFRNNTNKNDQYDPSNDSLQIKGHFSHSYITQLMRSRRPSKTYDSASVSNILLTDDNLIVLGYRGGHSYSKTLMTIPAGSLQYCSGKNPLFETLYQEHVEETGLTKDSIISIELLGRVFDHTLSLNSLYVFRTKTQLTFAELLHQWNNSSDKKEHKFLIAIPDDPATVTSFLTDHAYNPGSDNVGTVLPPAAVSLLLHFGHKMGKEWLSQIPENLQTAYVSRFA